jgi:hypothetical protein
VSENTAHCVVAAAAAGAHYSESFERHVVLERWGSMSHISLHFLFISCCCCCCCQVSSFSRSDSLQRSVDVERWGCIHTYTHSFLPVAAAAAAAKFLLSHAVILCRGPWMWSVGAACLTYACTF